MMENEIVRQQLFFSLFKVGMYNTNLFLKTDATTISVFHYLWLFELKQWQLFNLVG